MQSKLRLTISSYDDLHNPFYAGGGARSVHEVAKRLSKHLDVTVLTGAYPGSKDEVVDGIAYKRIGIATLGPKLGQLIYTLLLPILMGRQHFDVWIESFTPPLSTSFLPLFTKKPVIGLAHMLPAADMERKYKLPFRFIERIGLRRYRWVITPSPSDVDKIKTMSPNTQVSLIPNGVSVPKLHPKTQPTMVSFMGRIEIDQKGLDLLLHAFKLLKKKSLKLQIAGSGEPSEMLKLQRLISKHQLQERVTLYGRLEGKEKMDFLARTKVMVIPSRFETFSLVALETIAAGIPLVYFDIDGLSWLRRSCGIAVPAFDTSALADAITKLASNKKLANQSAIQGKQLAKHYTWQRATRAYKDLLTGVAYV